MKKKKDKSMKRSDQRKKWAKAYKDNRFVYTYTYISTTILLIVHKMFPYIQECAFMACVRVHMWSQCRALARTLIFPIPNRATLLSNKQQN